MNVYFVRIIDLEYTRVKEAIEKIVSAKDRNVQHLQCSHLSPLSILEVQVTSYAHLCFILNNCDIGVSVSKQ